MCNHRWMRCLLNIVKNLVWLKGNFTFLINGVCLCNDIIWHKLPQNWTIDNFCFSGLGEMFEYVAVAGNEFGFFLLDKSSWINHFRRLKFFKNGRFYFTLRVSRQWSYFPPLSKCKLHCNGKNKIKALPHKNR